MNKRAIQIALVVLVLLAALTVGFLSGGLSSQHGLTQPIPSVVPTEILPQ